MTVSFIIPTRNQARFIRRCIDSCLAQSIPAAEIIVVDGLSTDGTQDILRAYGDQIRWTSEADSGQAQAVNKGVARASGELIAWINSDDCYASPDAVRTAIAAFDTDSTIDLVYGKALVADERGAIIRAYRDRRFVCARDVVINPIGPPQPATFFRRDLFQRVGGVREELHWTLDYDLFVRLFAVARNTCYLPQTLAHTTFHANAKSIRCMLSQIRELGRVKRHYKRHLALRPSDHALLWWGMWELYLYWAAVRLGLRRAT